MWIGTEVTVYKLFGLISRYAQSLSETECRYTVNYGAYKGRVPLVVSAGTGKNWLEAH